MGPVGGTRQRMFMPAPGYKRKERERRDCEIGRLRSNTSDTAMEPHSIVIVILRALIVRIDRHVMTIRSCRFRSDGWHMLRRNCGQSQRNQENRK